QGHVPRLVATPHQCHGDLRFTLDRTGQTASGDRHRRPPRRVVLWAVRPRPVGDDDADVIKYGSGPGIENVEWGHSPIAFLITSSIAARESRAAVSRKPGSPAGSQKLPRLGSAGSRGWPLKLPLASCTVSAYWAV